MATNLTHIRVAGFKSIREMALDLADLNVLVGANGAGKSNFVSLFRMLGLMVDDRLRLFVGEAGGPDALLTKGGKSTARIELGLHFGRHGYEAKFSRNQANELMFQEERCLFYGDGHVKPQDVWLGPGHTETRLSAIAPQNEIVRHVLDAMKGWRVFHYHDTSSGAKVKHISDIDDNAFLRGDAGNLAAFLLLLRDHYPLHYREIVETVRMVAPFFHDFQLGPTPANDQKIQLQWRDKDADAYFNAHALSDGTLRFICLATLLLQPDVPSIIVIDEPELGLHPYAISLLASLLRAAAKRTQVIVSTQSVSLVDQFDPEHIVVVDREPQGSVFRRLPPEEVATWIDGYSLGELWEKNVFGGRPR